MKRPLLIGAALRPGKKSGDDVVTLMFPFGVFEIDVSDAQTLHDAIGVALGVRAHATRLLGEGSGQEDLRGPEDAES